jgi:hypothetical protein
MFNDLQVTGLTVGLLINFKKTEVRVEASCLFGSLALIRVH